MVENVSLMTKRLKQMQKCLKQQSKDFYAPDFGAPVKRWSKGINVGGGYVKK
jgi:hypothetical protein